MLSPPPLTPISTPTCVQNHAQFCALFTNYLLLRASCASIPPRWQAAGVVAAAAAFNEPLLLVKGPPPHSSAPTVVGGEDVHGPSSWVHAHAMQPLFQVRLWMCACERGGCQRDVLLECLD